MASSLLKANTKIPTRSLLSWISRHIANQDYCHVAHRNLITISWNNEPGFSGPLPVSPVFKPCAQPLDLWTLKEKEKNDWRLLTLEEKKMLYDMSFSHPFETVPEDAEWKSILAGTFFAMGLTTIGIYLWLTNYGYVDFVDRLSSREAQHTDFVSDCTDNKEIDSSFDCNSRH